MRKIFSKWFWEDKYYDFTWGIRNLYTHFKIVWKSRPWDFNYSPLEILKFKLEEIVPQLIHEEDESRNKKIKDIKRCIELIDYKLTDNYTDRVGELHCMKHSMEFELIEGSKSYRMKEYRTPEEMEEDSQTFLKAHELEQKEWTELWILIKDNGKGWWD